MSALFFKISWPQNVERYRSLRTAARRQGKSLIVKNMSRQRGVPIFIFFLSPIGSDRSQPFSDLSAVEAAIQGSAT